MIALENGLFPPFKSVAHLAAASEPGSWSPGQPGSGSAGSGSRQMGCGLSPPGPPRSPRSGCLPSPPHAAPTGPEDPRLPGAGPSPLPPSRTAPGALPRHPRAPRGGLLSARPNAQPRLEDRAPGLCGRGCSFACEWGSLVNPRASAGARRRRRRKGGRSQLGVNEVGKESFRGACKQTPSLGNNPPSQILHGLT